MLRRILRSKLLMMMIGCVVVALLIWFLGPLLGVGDGRPLGGTIQRMFAATFLPIIFGLRYAFVQWRDKKENEEAALALAGGGTAQREVEDLGSRLREALDTLKKGRFSGSAGRRYLYQLPWYMFIGPPGSGKTTALTNSGLNFPLAAKFGKSAVKGVGGTRSCDWWFTDDAVLIDTAGRYTTQDSETEQDKTAWLGFLKLLKKHRKRQPLNGILVAIGVSDLMAAPEAQRLEHAHAVRQRVNELYAELGVRLPVYVLFTKADLIAGFVEFFDDLNREDRETVWGMTFVPQRPEPEGGYVTAYAEEFDALVGRLDDRLIERLQQETDVQRRSMVFGFPQQFASVKEITQRFLEEAFEPNRYEQPILVRGVYFTSGTQEGAPIDRLMGAMASTFGIGRQLVPPSANAGRSYFLSKLLRQVVFGEAGLVNADPAVERRSRRIRLVAYSAAAILVLGMAGLWTASYLNNRALVDQVTGIATDYNTKVKALTTGPVTDPDLRPVVPLLDTLRDLPGGFAHRDEDPATLYGFGLYQGYKLGASGIDAYHRAVSGLLLPRLLVRLENQLSSNQGNADFLYEGLKVYLMLGRQGPLDKGLVKQWMALDWNAQYPGPENQAMRTDLAGHLDALLRKPLPQMTLDADLVAKSRDILNRMPLAERAYSLIRTDPKVTALPEWRIADNAGPASSRVFVRASGRSLADGIPGLYTYDGFYKVFRPLLPDIAKEVAKESWVLGSRSAASEDPVAVGRLQRDVTDLYLEDFAEHWERLLGDVTIPSSSFTSVGQAAAVLNILSAPDSPVKQLVVSAARETTLSKAPPIDPNSIDPATALLKVAGGAASRAAPTATGTATGAAVQGQATDRLAGLLGTTAQSGDTIEARAGRFTDQRFKALHDLAGSGQPGAAGPIDAVVSNLGDLYKSMNALGTATDAGGAQLTAAGGGGAAVTAQLQATAARVPDPVKSWLTGVSKASSTLTVGGARSELNGLWTANVASFCRTATDNRYPIYRTGSSDVTLDDFSRLFSKGGLIDGFFNTNLRQFVDMSKAPWRWQKVDNLDLGLSPAVLVQFERAAGIRDSMFPGGGAKPGVSFELMPTSLDAKSTQVLVELDGQSLSYNHGPPRPAKMDWPGPGPSGVRISFQPQAPGEPTSIVKDGTWAWFRLLDQARITPAGGPDRFTVTFNVGSRSASFEIRANSVINPFASDQLSSFRCPATL